MTVPLVFRFIRPLVTLLAQLLPQIVFVFGIAVEHHPRLAYADLVSQVAHPEKLICKIRVLWLVGMLNLSAEPKPITVIFEQKATFLLNFGF
ncbi:MAG TPA: hypothetical protein VJ783_08615 [Pirellulales bacterium]|nr:hypothetical protein [Pirellulales bacterium]